MNETLQRIRETLEVYVPAKVQAPDRTPAAVIMPLIERDGELFVIFTKRTLHLRYHQGEICFPGGSIHTDEEDLQKTALRELEEELAVPSERVEILGQLDQIRSVASFFVVTPYIGLLHPETVFQPSATEVDEVIEAPFRHFENRDIFREEERIIDEKNIPVYYYQWQSHTIWGLTARILKNLLDLVSATNTLLKEGKHD